MNVVLWVLQGVLAVAFLASGVLKLITPKEKAAERMPYVRLFPEWALKAIGALEVAAAIGLILPAATGIAPVLTPLAAVGLILLMVGAMIVHLRLKEYSNIVVNLVLLALAAIVAWGRFGPYAF